MQRRAERVQSPELQYLLESSNQFYQDSLGYKPEQTSIHEISKIEWNELARRKGFDLNLSGVYLPRSQEAIFQRGNFLGLFHEYFGHGLYCEQTPSGMILVDLEKRLLEEEMREFSGREFNLDNVKKFREKNQTFSKLDSFRKENLTQYELFAIWTEHLLSNEFGLKDEFCTRHDSLSIEGRELFDSVIDFSNRYGNLATFYLFGLGKIQDEKRLQRLSEDIFGSRLSRTPLLLHFGSGKPFSDIDIFVASKEIPSSYDSWLDVRAYDSENIENEIMILNPMVTDPLMTGKLIFGGKRYLSNLRNQILNQPITENAINFSLQEYEHEKRMSKDKSLGQHLQNKNLRSAKTFLTNALALKNGYKILTFKGLVDYSHSLSRSEKYIELKGGIE